MNKTTYTQNGDYFIPDIGIKPHKPIGRYGILRKTYLRDYRPVLYNELVLSEQLYEHCDEIDDTCRSRMKLILPELAKSAGATEKLKADDPMRWVGLMNCCKAQAEEIVKFEIIYT